MASPFAGLHFDNTLGAAFLGCIAAAVLYGVTTVQTFTYYRSHYLDSFLFKYGVVGFLWTLDTFHLAFVIHGLYYYMISNFTNPLAALSPTWSLLSQVYLTIISDLVVRCVFTHRVWMLSNRNHIWAIFLTVTSLFVFASGLAFGTRGFIDETFERLIDESWMLYTSLGSAVLADLAIAFSLCWLLQRSRTGFKRTDCLVNVLMLYGIGTGLLTSFCAAACFITFAIWPHNFIFIGVYFSLGKLYLISLLAVLNSRATMCQDHNSTAQSHPSHSNQVYPMRLTPGATTDSTFITKVQVHSVVESKYADDLSV